MISADHSSPAPKHPSPPESHAPETCPRDSAHQGSWNPWTDEGWKPKRIAIFRALHLGDLLCATPALRALRRRFPDSEITLIGLPWAEELVRRLPELDRLECFQGYPGLPEVAHDPERVSRFFDKARAARYDLAIQMHGDGTLSNSFVAALGAQVTVGYRRFDDDRLTLSLPYIADESEVLRWLRLVALLGAKTDDHRLAFPTGPEEVRRATTLLSATPCQTGPLVGLHPGASTPLRRWPDERFAELADALVERWNARVVLTGSEAERELTSQVCSAAHTSPLDLGGQMDLGTFAALLGQLDLLVTNDTGASHLAAAAGTPSVVIFATTSPFQWAPPNRDRHLVVDARTHAAAETPPVEALARLPVEPVLLACERHLNAGLLPSATSRAPS